MATVKVKCSYFGSEDIVWYEKKQYLETMPADLVQKQIAMNGSGVLNTGQVLGISKYTVTAVKKRKNL